jgi:hypothetical protein
MPETLTTEAPNAVIVDQGLLYVRNPLGEVVAVDANDTEVMKKVRRGWTPLFEYGQFGSSSYYMDHPYECLFQAGGARELSAEQVIAMGYHLRPPIVPTCDQHVGQSKEHLAHGGNPAGRSPRERGCWNGARPAYFPQLDGREFTAPDECEYCGRDDFATEHALHQHQSVMHNDRRQQVELADGIVAGLVRSGSLPSGSGSPADIAAAVVIALRTLEQPTKSTPSRVRRRGPNKPKPASVAVLEDED